MKPETIYKPVFKNHNLPRYLVLQNDLCGLITDKNQHTLYISMAHFSCGDISIYIKHILYPLITDLRNKQISYHILISVGREGENKMTVLRKELTYHCIQFLQETRRKISIYG